MQPLLVQPSMLIFDRLPTPVPFEPLSRAGSQRSVAHGPTPDSAADYSKTNSFFSTPARTPQPPTPVRAATVHVPPSTSTSSGHATGHQKSRSVNDAFFFGPTVRVTPPPSALSAASSEDPQPRRIPLSRFFPSRRRRTSGAELDPEATLDLGTDPRALTRVPSPPPSAPSTSGSPPRSEPEIDPNYPPPEPNTTIGAGTPTPLHLLRPIGTGAFSSVWLASDVTGLLTGTMEKPHNRNNRTEKPQRRLRSQSAAKRKRDWRIHGLKPAVSPSDPEVPAAVPEGSALEDDEDEGAGVLRQRSVVLRPPRSHTSFEDDEDVRDEEVHDEGTLVAVKMMSRGLCNRDDRMRISFVREVEVLRHISHPSLITYLHSFTTDTHHCLVISYIPSGDLLTILSSDQFYTRLREPHVRRIWSELAKAVGWMHSVGLVHRDIKLENILLTANPLITDSDTPEQSLPPLHTPLIKLTDFNLSRFIDPATPRLTTKCGSEAYAAPELILSSSSADGERGYDGRETDAWACGVVLYGIACRRLPFDHTPPHCEGMALAEQSMNTDNAHETLEQRKALLTRIAFGSFSFPSFPSNPTPTQYTSFLLLTPALRSLVSKFLVRDPKARMKMGDAWGEDWMWGAGRVRPPVGWGGVLPPSAASGISAMARLRERSASGRSLGEPEAEGILVDGECIDRIARSEVA